VSGFRFPDGVEFLGSEGSEARFTVSIPLEEDRHLGRECPVCGQHFRIDNGLFTIEGVVVVGVSVAG